MITRAEAWAKFIEYHDTQGSRGKIYIIRSKINKSVQQQR